MHVKLNVTINEFSVKTHSTTITNDNGVNMVPAGMLLKDFNVNYESEMDTQEYQAYIKLTGEMLAELISNMAKLNG